MREKMHSSNGANVLNKILLFPKARRFYSSIGASLIGVRVRVLVLAKDDVFLGKSLYSHGASLHPGV